MQSIVKNWYNIGTERPKRITPRAITRQLGFSKDIFQNLPMCLELIYSNMETQEQYYAREVIWAINEIERQGKPLCITRIYELTNMERRQFCSCLNEIQDTSLKAKLELL